LKKKVGNEQTGERDQTGNAKRWSLLVFHFESTQNSTTNLMDREGNEIIWERIHVINLDGIHAFHFSECDGAQ